MEQSGYTTLQEINCIVHWFKGWTSRQKDEFLKDLISKAVPEKVDLLLEAIGNMNMSDQAPSIFQCQMRLFGQWFDRWSIQERNFMVEKLESCEPQFVSDFYERVRATAGRFWTITFSCYLLPFHHCAFHFSSRTRLLRNLFFSLLKLLFSQLFDFTAHVQYTHHHLILLCARKIWDLRFQKCSSITTY